METAKKLYYSKRGEVLVKNLKKRHFDAVYCDTKEDALKQAIAWIPEGSTVGWGGATSAQQIGLMAALNAGNYHTLDRDQCETAQEREKIAKDCLSADVFITGANAISMDGQMVNIDGNGNRVAAIIYGPGSVVVIAGMNKVTDDLEGAITRARTVAAPINQQRFGLNNPCTVTGSCADCKSETCICNHIVVTRHCRPVGRIKFILVGEELGF
ncbi:MAG: lactate utilization protein [Oscillospiraceae bacterium]|nr:lactate utilization protein [Oscillospiraceae bacterium]